MSHRTTILLDSQTRRAAKELALHYDCSGSEAIRRAILHERDRVMGVAPERAFERKKALSRLFELFDGHDADAEIARLKEENAGF